MRANTMRCMFRRLAPKPAIPSAVILAAILGVDRLAAQAPTPDPGAWRLMGYSDLSAPSPANAIYFDIWQDVIEETRRAQQVASRNREDANARIVEAHFVIWSPGKSVVLSVLHAASCVLKESSPHLRARVKRCPMRIVFYEGLRARTMDAGTGCFLDIASHFSIAQPNAGKAVAYASYDIATKAIRTGLILDGEAVDGCSQTIPLYPK